MLKSIDESLPVSTVRATRGKYLRAEPVAALYEQGRVAHAGASSRWKTRCATSARTGFHPTVRPTGWMRWSGR
jgi:phage terminase large subunit-like protein